MTFTEVTGAVENLDKMDWANLNLFFPRKLQIAKDNEDITKALNYIYTPSDGENGNFSSIVDCTEWAVCKPLLKEIRNVKFSSIPISKENGMLIANKKNSNSTVDLVFHLDKPLSPMTLYRNWKSKLYDENLNKEGSNYVFKKSLKTGDGYIAEGTLISTYVGVKRQTTGISLETLGELVITGLIPVGITAPSSLGPGLSAKSSAEEVAIKCTYSLGYLQIGSSVSDAASQRLWME